MLEIDIVLFRASAVLSPSRALNFVPLLYMYTELNKHPPTFSSTLPAQVDPIVQTLKLPIEYLQEEVNTNQMRARVL